VHLAVSALFSAARVDLASAMSTSPDLGGGRVLPESTCGDVRDDTAAFVRRLRAYAEGAKAHGKLPLQSLASEHPVERVVEDMFDWSAPVFVARAPGRLDVMGGIADYSGSLVLQMPIAEACHVAVQFRNLELSPADSKKASGSGTTTVVSLNADPDATPRVFRMPTVLALLTHLGPAREMTRDDAKLTQIRNTWKGTSEKWVAYPLGVLAVLEHFFAVEHGEPLEAPERDEGSPRRGEPSTHPNKKRKPFRGFESHVDVSVLISSDVPEGAGVSSSAAVETATAHGACAALSAYLPDSFVRLKTLNDVVNDGDDSKGVEEYSPTKSSRRIFSCDEGAGSVIATWCQMAENFVADAPCGIMDQMCSGLGEANALLALLCRPAFIVQRAVVLPRGVRVWGIDSGNAHSVGGGDYGVVRAAAFMCRAAVAKHLGVSRIPGEDESEKASHEKTRETRAGKKKTKSAGLPPLTAMVTPSEFDTLIGSSWLTRPPSEERERVTEDERVGSVAIDDATKKKKKTPPLPPLGESVGADAFVKRHPEGHGDDGVTELDFDPLTKYPVTLAGRHPVLEHERVRAFYDAIVAMNAMDSRDDDDDDGDDERASKKKAFLSTLGASMFASHASYGALGLGDAGTDAIVGMVRDGRGRGRLHGAKITGGGSGGTVCVLGEDDDAGEADYAIEDVRARYARRRVDDENLSSSRANANALPHLFRGSSPGAASYGYLALRLDGA
jgi:L-arabinokinase